VNGNFWKTLPGILTAAAGIITAVTGLVVAITQTGVFDSHKAPAADVSGAWTAQVTYSWGATYPERFVFQVDKGRLVGTMTFLRAPRGIEDGVVEGDRIKFTVRAEELLGSERRPYQLSYTGTAVGGGVHFVLEDSRGNSAVQFAAARELPTP
jgi:hypothetical protein